MTAADRASTHRASTHRAFTTEASEHYRDVSRSAATRILRSYSTSFSLAVRLLGPGIRQHVINIYALVRVADELVDGAGAGAGLSPEEILRDLDALEQQTLSAMTAGYSTNPIIHAFSGTARSADISADEITVFFRSMRSDVMDVQPLTLSEYIDGSAEVVGLMCLKAFLTDLPTQAQRAAALARLTPGARALGSAFQKINFLRDVGEDLGALGRAYLTGATGLTDSVCQRILAEVDDELALADRAAEALPASSRHAVMAALTLYRRLAEKLRSTPADQIQAGRIRVSNPEKLLLTGRVLGRAARERVGLEAARRVRGVVARTARRRRPAPGGGGLRAVIIGGGVAGLASAILLARDGYAVTVVEKNERVGGRAGVRRRSGFTFDTGPSWWLMPQCFEHFYRMAGTSVEREVRLVDLAPAYRVFSESQEPLDVTSGSRECQALFESVEPGAGRALADYLESSERVYEMAVRHFLYTAFPRLSRIVTPELLPRLGTLAEGLLTSLHSRAARTVTDGRLRQILGYPAVFLGGSPRTIPSLYHLMSHMDLGEGVKYPLGGFGTFVASLERLAAKNGVVIRTSMEAEQILVTPGQGPLAMGRATGVRVLTSRESADGPAGTSVEIPADIVVAGADLHHVETALLPPHLQTHPERAWARKTPSPSAVLVMLGVEGELPHLTHHSLFFTEDWDANFRAILGQTDSLTMPDPTSIYVCAPSRTDPSVAPAGHENLFILVPVPAGTDIDVEETADRAVAQVAQWAGVPDLGERIVERMTVGPDDFAKDVHAWRGTMLGLAHTLGQSAMFRGPAASDHVENLYYVGSSALPGIGLPMCLISAEILVKTLRDDLTPGPLPEPELGPGLGSGPGPGPRA